MKSAVIVVTMGMLGLGGWSGCSSPPPPAREVVTWTRPIRAPAETLASPPAPAPEEPRTARVEGPTESPLVTEIVMIAAPTEMEPPPAIALAEDAPDAADAEDAPDTADAPMTLVPIFAGAKPKLLEMPVPVFPENVDFEAVFPGWVELEIELEVDGSVLGVSVLDASSPELRAPLRQAVSGAQYTVARDPNGVAVRVTFRDRIEL